MDQIWPLLNYFRQVLFKICGADKEPSLTAALCDMLTLRRQWQNTYIYDDLSRCDGKATPIQCSVQHGGFFRKDSSTTWKQFADINASGATADFDDRFADNIWGVDTVSVNSTFAVPDAPVAIIDDIDIGTNLIGLGQNSTFLNALFAKGAIPSKTWGLSMGWYGAEPARQMDGSLVLGGYDSARTSGLNSTYPFARDASRTSCPGGLVVTISNIALNLANGSSPSLLPASGGSALQACLDPSFTLLQFPQDIFLNFLNLTGYSGRYPDLSEGINYFGMVIRPEEAYVLEGSGAYELEND
ncbi:MAG: hypothetical protein Q9219_001192 [cf. Caloplaca sp. 3 TL-2023]